MYDESVDQPPPEMGEPVGGPSDGGSSWADPLATGVLYSTNVAGSGSVSITWLP
jgi:hypothetical protein